jgi:hypothetical protein
MRRHHDRSRTLPSTKSHRLNAKEKIAIAVTVKFAAAIPQAGSTSLVCSETRGVRARSLNVAHFAKTTACYASPNSRIAFPLDPGHSARENINIERAIVPDSVFLALLGYGVMSGRQGNPKSPLIIRGKRCDFRSLFVLHDESGIRERFRTGSIRPDRSTLSWTKRNHSFDPCS